jgi:addiction module HigA family antidote
MSDESIPAGRPEWRPCHPGTVLCDILEELGLSVAEAAQKLGLSRQTLHRLLSGRAAMTPEMVVQVGKLIGDGPRIWLAMQQAHDLRQAERDLAEEGARIPTLHAA